MKNTVLAVMLSLAFMSTGCLRDDSMGPEIIVDPPFQVLVSQDTITTGAYLGLGIGSSVENIYSTLQTLDEKGIQYVNVVGNFYSDLNLLSDRIHLYHSIFLDEQKGTDSGVQITFEAGKVKSIYLNSGKRIGQWPSNENASNSVREGDEAETLYAKLVKIRSKSAYANKFERISLFTKVLSSAYDPGMTNSPQWYFRYEVEPGLYEDVKINIENGTVKYLEVSRYKDPS